MTATTSEKERRLLGQFAKFREQIDVMLMAATDMATYAAQLQQLLQARPARQQQPSAGSSPAPRPSPPATGGPRAPQIIPSTSEETKPLDIMLLYTSNSDALSTLALAMIKEVRRILSHRDIVIQFASVTEERAIRESSANFYLICSLDQNMEHERIPEFTKQFNRLKPGVENFRQIVFRYGTKTSPFAINSVMAINYQTVPKLALRSDKYNEEQIEILATEVNV